MIGSPPALTRQGAFPLLQLGYNGNDTAADKAGRSVLQLGAGAAQLQPLLINFIRNAAFRCKGGGGQNALNLLLRYFILLPAAFTG